MTAPVYYCSPEFKVGTTSYDITDGTHVWDPEQNEVQSTTSFYPMHTHGNVKAEIKIKTKNATLAALCSKGAELTDVSLTWKRAVTAPAGPQGYAAPTGTLEFKITNAHVTAAPEYSGASDKKESEYSITLTAARKYSDNSEPVVTLTPSGA